MLAFGPHLSKRYGGSHSLSLSATASSVGRASLSVNVTDPFDIYDSSIERSARDFVEIGRERMSMRRVTMNLSYGIWAGGGQRGGGDRRGRGG